MQVSYDKNIFYSYIYIWNSNQLHAHQCKFPSLIPIIQNDLFSSLLITWHISLYWVVSPLWRMWKFNHYNYYWKYETSTRTDINVLKKSRIWRWILCNLAMCDSDPWHLYEVGKCEIRFLTQCNSLWKMETE